MISIAIFIYLALRLALSVCKQFAELLLLAEVALAEPRVYSEFGQVGILGVKCLSECRDNLTVKAELMTT